MTDLFAVKGTSLPVLKFFLNLQRPYYRNLTTSDMATKPSSKDQPAFGDPYELLGVAPGASDAEITKAYRKLALKLHPDKQKGSTTSKQTEQNNKRFHDIKEARTFLLDPENREWRIKYEAKLASERLRREDNARREKGMSEHRKKLRDELRRKEEEERSQRMKLQKSTEEDGTIRKKRRDDQDYLDKLRKEGSKMREDFAHRSATEAAKHDIRQRKEEKALLEDRQVWLKWSRSRIQISPSEHSLAALLSRFGQVESVEMIGSKGNSALVTFVDASSRLPCVEAYAESDEMRANLVGRRGKEHVSYPDVQERSQQQSCDVMPPARDSENLDERKIRQAEERERLRQQMEEAENDESGVTAPSTRNQQAPPDKHTSPLSTVSFPFPFPGTPEFNDLLPWQKLEKAEQLILGGILPLESLRRMQFSAG